MDQFNSDDLSRFSKFSILTTTYKSVLGHDITTDVLIPASVVAASSPKHCPVLLRIHGGGLIAGSSLFPDFFAPWHLELAERHSAVIISPNYRLAPEASVPEILQDMQDLWTWVQTKLTSWVSQETNGKIQVDMERIMVSGDSAGGYLSLMLGLDYPDKIRAVTAAYPLVDAKCPHFVEDYEKPMFGLPHLPRSIITDHLKKVDAGKLPAIVSAETSGERLQLMFAMVQNAGMKDLFPIEKRELFILERLQDGARFPRGGVFVWHGQGDTVNPVESSLKLEKTISRLDPDLTFRLAIEQGDHGFDSKASIDDGWMADGMRDLLIAWLK